MKKRTDTWFSFQRIKTQCLPVLKIFQIKSHAERSVLQNRFRLDFLLFPEPVSGVHKELAVQQILLLVAFAKLFQRNTDLWDAVVQYAVRSDVVFCKIGAPLVESLGHLLRNLIFF